MNVAIIGVTGYAGMVLYQILQHHPKIIQINLYQHGLTEPRQLRELVPQLPSDHKRVLPYDSAAVIKDNDAVFFATPAGITSQLAAPYLAADFPVIDLSGDFRLKDGQQYQKWYGKQPPAASALAKAYYGLADLGQNPGHNYVANPGCYATATLLGLAPVVKNKLIDVNSIIVDAKSGVSGAGKKLSDSSHFVNANENLQIYKPNQHKHIPEMMAEIKQWDPTVDHMQFMTTLVPINRGIMSTIYVQVKPGVDQQAINQAFEAQYHGHPFVHVLDALPTVKGVVGTNECHIGTCYNPVTNSLMIVSVIDNMVKGAAGQAVQNFNQLFNLDATLGLKLSAVLP